MEGTLRGSRIFRLVALVCVLCGCERGCLSRWLDEHGAGGAAPAGQGGAAPPGKGRSLDLAGTDCSDGLLRCVDGRVEASRAAHLPDPCTARAGEGRVACACPWDVVGACRGGCASDGLEVVAPVTDATATQMCRAEQPVARPVLPSDPAPSEVCAAEGVACIDGIVRACEGRGQPVRPVATCLLGCEPQLSLAGADPGAPADPDGLASILCRRRHAERQ